MDYTEHHLTSRLNYLTSCLNERDPICDPDFDDGLAELEREFAELRMQLANNEPERNSP